MKILLAFISFLVSGCTTLETITIPKEVRVPVRVSCVSKDQIPVYPKLPTNSLPPKAGIWDQMSALRIERLMLRNHVDHLRALLKGCTEE